MAISKFAVICACVTAVLKLIHMAIKTRKFTQKFKHLPQLPSNPIFGHLLMYPGPNDEGLAIQIDVMKQCPRLNVVWIAQTPIVSVCHPDCVKIILKSSVPKSYKIYNFLNYWIGDGLLKSNGSKWARNRRLLTPAFHFDILTGYLKLMNSISDDLLDTFEEASETGRSLDVFKCISMFTLDVMLQSTMSYETECQKNGKRHPYIMAVDRLDSRVVKRYLSPWLHSDFVYFMTPAGISFMKDCHFVHKVTDDIITNRRKELESGKGSSEMNGMKKRKHQDFLDTLLTACDEDGNGLTNREIRDEVDTFLFEGHDTTSSAISWALHSIAEHAEIQQRLHKEVDDMYDGRDSDNLLWEDLSKLPYLTMVVKESMRRNPPVPTIFRETTEDVQMDEFTIPAGTNVCLSIFNIHHNPSVWEDSMKFDPERFSVQNSEKRDPFAFIPFSAGSRNCIGQNFAMDEIKVALARILFRYEISLDPTHKVIRFGGMVMKAENDIKIYVKSRNNNTPRQNMSESRVSVRCMK